jgi:ribulose-phosphate 3-epimerase
VKVRIAPSILSANFADLAGEVRSVESHCDLFHIDVMDGRFVPNITVGPLVVKSIRGATARTLDCHLMIVEPQRYIDDFLASGANMISVHLEAEPHLQRALRMIQAGGARAGIAINPATSAELLADALDYCDYVLVMTVNPGFGGQKFIEEVVPKIRRVARMIRERGIDVAIEVDGGIDARTAPLVCSAGAQILVAGSAVFGQADRPRAIETIRAAVSSVVI